MIVRIGLPLAALLTVAAGIGLFLGLRATPPAETEIILRQADRYIQETGGEATDCYARPSALAEVRLVVICDPTEGAAWVSAVDRYGNLVETDADILAEEPQT